MAGLDLAKVVSVREPYEWTRDRRGRSAAATARSGQPRFHVVAYDFGVKYNILRMLAERGCRVTVVPAQTPAADVLALQARRRLPGQRPRRPGALRLRDRGDARAHRDAACRPSASAWATRSWRSPPARKTYKMKFGHHGANHPVKDLDSGRVSITSQNHGFAVDPKSLPANLRATHVSLFDGTLQGLARTDKPAFCFQGHPEASPGPARHRLPVRPLHRPDGRSASGGARMPKRTDLKTILIIGAGPIVIGQACEFDYSGAQACKALREEGYRVILVNSNPATIMTDPEMADVTYIEPITWQVVEKIIAKERPDALLPTLGGQTALNCALDLHKHGVLEKYGVEMIGANAKAIDKAEDRLKFKDAMTGIGLASAKSGIAHSMDEALAVQQRITHEIGGNGFPW